MKKSAKIFADFFYIIHNYVFTFLYNYDRIKLYNKRNGNQK